VAVEGTWSWEAEAAEAAGVTLSSAAEVVEVAEATLISAAEATVATCN
jgi:hypothetical protein